MQKPKHSAAKAVAILSGLFALALVAASARALDVLSPWGLAQWAATLVLAIGLLSWPVRRTRRVGPTRIGLAIFALILAVRVIVVPASHGARLATFPGDRSARWVDRFFEERDAAILGARLLNDTGIMAGAAEFPTLPTRLTEAYDLMDDEAPRMGSPVVATYLDLQRENAFDTFVIERADDATESDAVGTVVFLHGYAGNFAMQCWEVARAARTAGFRTLCPSTSSEGAWWEREGEAILRRTIESVPDDDRLARSGPSRPCTTGTPVRDLPGEHSCRDDRPIVLAGLSNGAIGASRLAPRVRGSIDALVLISGADPRADDPRVPVLMIQGDDDTMTRPSLARGYRAAHRARVRSFVELDGTHFVLLEQRDDVQEALARFLRTVAD